MSLGTRMKENYEFPSRHKLLSRTPVIIRVDGRAFHTFTRHMEKPFDQALIDNMVGAALEVARDMQGFKALYAQSDEVSFLLTDYDTLETSSWFDYVQSKLESVTASLMTRGFIFHQRAPNQGPCFDARAFNVPREEVVNYFVWRMKDWERNSLSMYCHAHFSHKQLHGLKRDDQHELLHTKGLNWTTDLPDQHKNGTWSFGGDEIRCDILPRYQEIHEVLHPLIYCDQLEVSHDTP